MEIFNSDGGSIGTGGNISITTGGNLTATSGNLNAEINNSSGGTIGSDAAITITAAGISTRGSLDAEIDNAGGSIGGDATINMNVDGTARVTNATIQILGNDPGGSAAINFNGGTYNVGGTFLSSIDGNGTITFTNTDVHANIIKAGVFGTNGTLIIGGSGSNTISADTLLKLYAPGSNGLLKVCCQRHAEQRHGDGSGR